MLVGVEPGRNQDQIGPELPSRREQLVATGPLVLVVAQSGLQRHVDRESEAGPHATLGHCARVRIEVILVDVEEENGGIVVEDGLGSVAVVHIPVHNQDSFELVVLLGVPGRDGDVVEKAESHTAIRHGVVSSRPRRAERIADLARDDRIDGPEHATRRQPCHLVGLAANRRVH